MDNVGLSATRLDLRRGDGRCRSERVARTSWRLVASCRAHMVRDTLETCHGRRWGMFDRVAVLAAAPVASLLALLFELFLCFGVGESKAQLDTGGLAEGAVVFPDDTLSDFARLKPGEVSDCGFRRRDAAHLAKPTSLLTPEGTSRQILVETAW